MPRPGREVHGLRLAKALIAECRCALPAERSGLRRARWCADTGAVSPGRVRLWGGGAAGAGAGGADSARCSLLSLPNVLTALAMGMSQRSSSVQLKSRNEPKIFPVQCEESQVILQGGGGDQSIRQGQLVAERIGSH